MPGRPHYFILNEAHDPAEVTLDEWCHWRAINDPVKKTVISINSQVTTKWGGLTDDVTMPGPPQFFHIVEGPGIRQPIVHTPTYEEALARHDRIAEWLRKRADKLKFER